LPTTKEESNSFRADDKQVIESKQPKLNIEEYQTFPDGRKVVLLTNKVPLLDKQNNVIGILGIYHDITERKKKEEELQIAKEKTEQAYHSKTEFISIASHEIRGPVGNVIAMIDEVTAKLENTKKILYGSIVDVLAEAGKIELINDVRQLLSETEEEAKKAKIQAHRSLNALTNLGNLHRLQTEETKQKPEISDTEELFKKAISQSKLLDDKNIDIYLEVNPTVPAEVIIDYYNLYEALYVILSNAVRFSHKNGLVKVKVDTTEENSQNYLVIKVQDFGVGIADNQLKHLFKTTLHAEEQTIESRYRKPSLQLPQAKMKIEVSGGRIQIESKLNQGTTVTIYVPYQLKSQLTEQALKSLSLPETKPLHLLLIEDDLTAQAIEKRYLEELGHTVDVAVTGTAAITLGTKNNYDMVLMDITLPDISGISVMRKIQQVKGNETPFIAVTSHASDDDDYYFISQGAVTVLTKPVTKQELNMCIRDVMVAKAHLNDDAN
jgi:signal transduction histidine kinase/CheY-like chemotaxis protein